MVYMSGINWRDGIETHKGSAKKQALISRYKIIS